MLVLAENAGSILGKPYILFLPTACESTMTSVEISFKTTPLGKGKSQERLKRLVKC